MSRSIREWRPDAWKDLGVQEVTGEWKTCRNGAQAGEAMHEHTAARQPGARQTETKPHSAEKEVVSNGPLNGPDLAFDEPNFPGSRPLGRFLGRELDALALAKQLEDGAAYRAAMEEVLDPSLVPDETEPLVDEKSRDRPGRHTRVLRST